MFSLGVGLSWLVDAFVIMIRAKNGTRTRDPDLGKVVLYQLSYFRIAVFNHSRR